MENETTTPTYTIDLSETNELLLEIKENTLIQNDTLNDINGGIQLFNCFFIVIILIIVLRYCYKFLDIFF